MEVLAGVSSGMAVASLSLQLIDTIKRINTFVHNIKDAPKELSRLEGLLERLDALLQDIQAAVVQQTSLLGHQMPAPSASIYHGLQACEKSLEPLLELVKKHQDTRAQGNSTIARLKSDIRLGLKTKDIAEYEVRIQQDIDYLHTALSTNMMNIM
jgi:hypothetical protein